MPIQLNKNAVFMHIPKTGGTWVTNMLREVNQYNHYIRPKHLSLDRMLAENRLSCEDKPFIFTFVRRPTTWYESYYKFQTNHKPQAWPFWGDLSWQAGRLKNWHPNAVIGDINHSDFPTFIEAILEKIPGYVTELYSYYSHPDLVDFIGKQESLRSDLKEVFDILDIDYDENILRSSDKSRVSPPAPIRWPGNLKERVIEAEKAAYMRYNYDT